VRVISAISPRDATRKTPLHWKIRYHWVINDIIDITMARSPFPVFLGKIKDLHLQ